MKSEITLPVCELKEALQGLSKVVGKSRTLPVLQSVKIARAATGTVTLQATDLDSMVTYKVQEAQPGAAVELLIPLDQLNKTVKGMKADDRVGLAPDGKDKVKVRHSIAGATVEQTMRTLPVNEFPSAPTISGTPMPLEPGFGVALKQAFQCRSEDSSRYILTGACLDVTDKKYHYVVGTNGRFLFSANSFCFDLQKSIIIPDSKFLDWTDLMDEPPCTLAVEPGQEEQAPKDGKPGKEAIPGWVKFESPRWAFATKEICGKFPNWKQVIPETNGKWTRITLSEDAIKQMLQVLPRLPGDYNSDHPVRLRIDKQLSLEGQNKDDQEWTSIPIQNVAVAGNPMTIGFNREYLVKALRFGLNQVEVEGPLSPAVFSHGGKKMVIMPLRLDGDEPTPAAPAAQCNPATTSPLPEQTTPPMQSEAQPEERKEMARTAKTTTTETTKVEGPVVETQTTTNNNATTNGNGSAIKSLVDHVEQIKDNLKNVIRDLAAVIDTVKLADKEKRTTEKEIEAVRAKLRQIQNVTI